MEKLFFLIKDKIRLLEIKMPTQFLIFLLNIENKVKKTGTKLIWNKSNGFFRAIDPMYDLEYCRKERSILYSSGVSERLRSLAQEYFHNKLPESFQGTFIDCGANIGELSLFVAKRYNCKVLAFEPEPLEYVCLQNNLARFSSAKVLKFALWEENKSLHFFSFPRSADSSLIPSDSKQKGVMIQARSLDSFFADYFDDSSVIILKVEAEGAEPEVIRGARRLLKRAIMVLVDGGPERGKFKEKTEPQNDFELDKEGFEKLSGKSTRCQVYLRRVNQVL